jgi:hypothetical protein
VSDFFNSLKADLLDRRLLPVVIVLGAGLAAALAYAVLGGGSGGATAQPAVSAPLAPGSAVIAVTPAQPNAGRAVAEITSGASQQRRGGSRNPFSPLPGAASTGTSTSTSSSTSTTVSKTSASSSGVSGSSSSTPSPKASSSVGTSSGSAGSGSEQPATSHTSPTPKGAQPAKPQTLYSVTGTFGAAPPGPLQPGVKLTQYANLRRQQALPSAKQPRVVFRGVRAGGKSATFTLVGEVLLRGAAACVPSASQCLAISLKPGQSEELEFLAPGGAVTSYHLKVLGITPVKASAAAAGRLRSVSKAGGLVLSRNGLLPLPGLRYSPQQGVLVPAGDG